MNGVWFSITPIRPPHRRVIDHQFSAYPSVPMPTTSRSLLAAPASAMAATPRLRAPAGHEEEEAAWLL